MKRLIGLALGLSLALTPGAVAQVAKGNVYGAVTDESGAVLPGATVALSGAFGSRATSSDSQGEFRFLAVDHGTHALTATLSGFTGVTRQVIVGVGRNVTIDFTLRVASVEEVVTVTAETPVVDAKEFGTATNITKDELARTPTSRDPWALMRTVPGVLVDRVNVAGSESGQQSSFASKGADDKDAVWSIDGITITDEVSMSSPAYYTYDQFDEVNFSTGANGAEVSAGGLGINIVTKRGTNAFRGSFGGYFTHDDLQSSNVSGSGLEGDARLQGNDKADHTEQIVDYSFDLGGPLIKDKLWFYGAFGRNDIRIKRLTQTQDKTILKNISGKLNWQASPNDMVSAFWFSDVKAKAGRAHSNLQETDGHLWDQDKAFQGGPRGLSKIEWNRVFGPSFFTNVKAAYYNTGFTLTPRAGLDVREITDNVAAIESGGAEDQTFLRPQYTISADGSYFAPGWGGQHEVKFGAAWRRAESSRARTQAADGVQIFFNTTGSDAARFWRDSSTKSKTERLSFWAGDTFTRGRVTLNASLRFDRIIARKLPTLSPANEAIPGVLPGLEFAGDSGNAIEWTDLSPRVGITYALDESRKTLVRASYARYSGLLSVGDADFNSPVNDGFLEFGWADRNGDRDVQLDEVDFGNVIRTLNVDPSDPTAASSPNAIDPDYASNKDDELIVGIEREIVPDFAVSAAYTWRKSTDLTASQLWSGYSWYAWLRDDGTPFVPSDYVPRQVTGSGFTATTYDPTAEAAAAFTGTQWLTNRADYSRTYSGAELALVKRLSNRWMGRVAFTFNDWNDDVGPGAIQSPTRHDLDPLDDGGEVVVFSPGSGKVFYRSAKWQINVNGLLELGRGFEVSANVFGRQGYPDPVFLSAQSDFIGFLNVLPDGIPIDDRRHDSLWLVDARLAKSIRFGGANVILSAELFNLFNDNVVLAATGDAASAAFERINEILAPRIIRFGARLTF